MCFILFANRFLNKVLNGIKTFYPVLNVVTVFYSVEKRFYSVENLVEKPVGEQDKTHEFSPGIFQIAISSFYVEMKYFIFEKFETSYSIYYTYSIFVTRANL